MIPFEPESIEKLKERLPKALEKIWKVTNPMPDRPGLHREHVFDFESGIRLLISRDQLKREKPEIHVSASWEFNPPNSIREMHLLVINSYRALGGKDIINFIGFSNKNIPHWIVIKED